MAEISRADLIRILGAGSSSFGGVNLTGVDLTDIDLSGLDFSGANCRGTHFDRANLCDTRFFDTVLANASFVGADLRNSSFRGAWLNGADFRDATLVGTIFEDAHCEEADFTGVTVDQTTNFKGAKLNNITGREYLRTVQRGFSSRQKTDFVSGCFAVVFGVLRVIFNIVGAIIDAMFGK
jgi:uncharacterized protein YjbI with pentapeptide repeats